MRYNSELIGLAHYEQSCGERTFNLKLVVGIGILENFLSHNLKNKKNDRKEISRICRHCVYFLDAFGS